MWNPDFSPTWVTLTSGVRRELRLERADEHYDVWTWLKHHECVPVVIAKRGLFCRDPDEWRDGLQSALRGAMDREDAWYRRAGLRPTYTL